MGLARHIAKTLYGDDDEEVTPQNSGTVEEPKFLGLYPGSNEKILLKNGPNGFYVQLGSCPSILANVCHIILEQTMLQPLS
ncbi:hypothetical protein CsSME_00051672 [Camellia sinensis var. sinensis]